MALVGLLLIKVYLGALARLHTYGIKHWTHTEDEIPASAELMANLLTAVWSGFPSVLPENETGGGNKNRVAANLRPSHSHLFGIKSLPFFCRSYAGSKLQMFPAPHMWVTQVARQKGCIITPGDKESGMTAHTGVCALLPLFALTACLYFFELPACNFLGLKATGPKAVQKLWWFLSAFDTRCTFWLVFHISRIWSHQHWKDTSNHRGVQSSPMAEPNNERHMYSHCEGFPSLP